jgi:rhodanese-related sulfurtransferase
MPRFRQKPVDLVVDVRSKLEYWLGHLPGAVCIPVQELAERIAAQPGVTKSSRILVYCASGARSAQAAQLLRQLGYAKVTDAGGIGEARPQFEAA